MTKSTASLIDSFKNRTAVIVGAGGTLRERGDQIVSFIKRSKAKTIGINNMTSVVIPDYHLWTNAKRWISYHKCVNSKSQLILGAKLLKKMNSNKQERLYRQLKQSKPSGEYVSIRYKDSSGLKFSYKNGDIKGYFRTAGCLAIMLAHLMSAQNIYIVGMDGFSFHSKKDLERKHHQHVYEQGFSDTATWKECVEKDRIVYSVLRNLREYGIRFSIITPTKFEEFYDGSLL